MNCLPRQVHVLSVKEQSFKVHSLSGFTDSYMSSLTWP